MPYWFFFSHAHDDRELDDKPNYLVDFYKDLTNEVKGRVAGELRLDEQTAFFDTDSINPGAEWLQTLTDAAQQSRVLVCLASSSYVASKFCGKEYRLFLNRRDEYVKDTAASAKPEIILPVLWIQPTGALPQSVSQFQYPLYGLPPEYLTYGLRYVMRLKADYGSHYERFITSLGDTIIAAGKKYAVKPISGLKSIDDVESEFHPVKRGAAKTVIPQQSPGGPNSAQFIFVAAQPHEFREAGVNRDPTAYGEDGWWWRPYHPDPDQTIGSFAQEVIAKFKDIRYNELCVAENLKELVAEARDRKEIIIVIVDAWTVRVEKYKKWMCDVDQASLWNSDVVVLLNDADADTKKARSELLSEIKRTFKNKSDFKIVDAGKNLKPRLRQSLVAVRMKILELGGEFKKPMPKDHQTPFGMISGPNGGQ